MMTRGQIETIKKLAESHDFKGVPIPQLCDLAILGAITRDKWYAEYFQPSAEMNWQAADTFERAKHDCISQAMQEDRDEVLARGRRLSGMAPLGD